MKLKGIILAVMISLASIMMPFTVYADTISTNNIEGINTILLSKTQNTANTNSYWFVYEHTITLDSNYVGTINLNINLTYYTPSGSPQQTAVATISNKNFYVNGNTIKINQVVTSDNYGNQGPLVSSSYLLNSSNVVKYDDIDSLEQIINLLNDIYSSTDDIEGLSTNQLTELENIVSNTSLANDYLDVISQIRQYDIPFESMNVCMYALKELNTKIVDVFDYSYMTYPLFHLSVGDNALKTYMNRGQKYRFIFLTSSTIVSTATFEWRFNCPNTITVSNYINYTNSFNISVNGVYQNGYICSVDLVNSEYSDVLFSANQEMYYTPIYFGLASNKYLSTDFALRFGLSNQLLDNVQIIANGTSQSQSASSNLESGNSQMADDMDDLATIENGYNQQFNNQLQQIDFSSPLQSNAGILPAANFVITIFNGLINNNPFSVLIIIVCILLIGKKVIGK